MMYSVGMENIPTWLPYVLIPLLLWSLFWKALALWHAARRGNTVWFIVLLLVNTIGILDIIYLIIAGKLRVTELFSKSETPTAPEEN